MLEQATGWPLGFLERRQKWGNQSLYSYYLQRILISGAKTKEFFLIDSKKKEKTINKKKRKRTVYHPKHTCILNGFHGLFPTVTLYTCKESADSMNRV